MRLVVAINDRCTISRDGRRLMVRSIDRCILRPIVRSIAPPEDRSIVGGNDRSHNQPYHRATDRMITRCDIRLIVTINRGTSFIWNRRLEVLNMTIDLAATDFAQDLCDQSCVLSMMCPRFQHFLVAGRS